MKSIVTGASSGIGRELARILCRDKKSVVLGVGRSVERLAKLSEQLGECFIPVQADLSRVDGVRIVVEAARRHLGEVDLLVNNAGAGLYKRVVEHSEEELISLTNVNFISPILLTRGLLDCMKPGSVVVFVITAGVHVLLESLPIYGATKAALHYAVKALRKELKERGVHVLAVYPGSVKTEFHERAGYELKRGLDPRRVALEIVRGVEKKKSELYIPGYLSIAKLLTPALPGVKGPAKR
jgi:short-subunit dehydrogenase